MEMLDKITIPKHNNEGPLRIPVWDKLRVSKWQNSRDRGLYIQGKLESGFIVDGIKHFIKGRVKCFSDA